MNVDLNTLWPSKTRILRTGAALLVWLAARQVVQADTIYDTFGPDPYVPNIRLYGISWSLGSGASYATRFVVGGQDYLLNSVTLDIGRIYENSPNLGIAILADNNGTPGETVLDWIAPNPTGILTQERQPHTFSSSLNPILLANTPYWLSVQPAILNHANDANNVEYLISTPWVTGLNAIRIFDRATGDWGAWQLSPETLPLPPVYRLDGTVVPEPGVLALAGLGLVLFALARRLPRQP
ncbi:MAG: PEP-CTERM sorting domain-containing protein [Verrucomicrobia bacterium]|nr:PEP-CTERM sorting domain-containing protein [Verrucomicrobiota bacterium]